MSSSGSTPAGSTTTRTAITRWEGSPFSMICGGTRKRSGRTRPTRRSCSLARPTRSSSRQKAGSPFFLYLTFGAPHYPMIAPKRFFDRLPASMDRDRRMHAAMVEALDESIGSVLNDPEAAWVRQHDCVLSKRQWRDMGSPGRPFGPRVSRRLKRDLPGIEGQSL